MGSRAKWGAQTSWYIDPVNGSDGATGADSSHQIQHRSEMAMRLDGVELSAPVAAYVASSLNSGDNLEPKVVSDLTNYISWVGTPRLLFTGTISALTNRSGSGSQATLMTISSIATSWTLGNGVDSFLNMLVVQDNGGGNFVAARVARDMGTKQAWLSPPIAQSNLESTFTNGATVSIYDVPSLGNSVYHNTAKQSFTYLKVAQRWLSHSGQLFMDRCWGDSFFLGGSVSSVNGVSGGLFAGANFQNLGARLTITGGYHRLVNVGGTCNIGQSATFTAVQVENSQAFTVVGGSFGTPDIEICTTSASLTPLLLPGFGRAVINCAGYVYGSTARSGSLFAELQGRDGLISLGHVPNVTGANTVSFTLAGTTSNVSSLSSASLADVNNNKVIGPFGP